VDGLRATDCRLAIVDEQLTRAFGCIRLKKRRCADGKRVAAPVLAQTSSNQPEESGRWQSFVT